MSTKIGKKLNNKDSVKYCLQYCYKGKCNNINFCTSIHDPSKIAICPRILKKNGCNKQDCCLSHDKTPDKMSDCRFFLRGRCTSNNCQYRHVKVNDNAKLCRAFTRGLCLRGLDCNKLHQYKCPSIRNNKTCKRGDRCIYYHPPPPPPSISNKDDNNKFKKINNNKTEIPKATATSAITTEYQPINLSSSNTKNLLNQILEKQLKSNQIKKINENEKQQNDDDKLVKKVIENLSFIPLSKDGDIDTMDQLKIDWIQMINRFHYDNGDDDGIDITNNQNNDHQSNHEIPKYFIIDSDDDDNQVLNLSMKSTSTTTETTNICRPKVKIVPDFFTIK